MGSSATTRAGARSRSPASDPARAEEFDLPELLDHRGLVLTRDQLLERVWGYTFAGDTRTVYLHFLQPPVSSATMAPLATVWGVGYKVADDAPVA